MHCIAVPAMVITQKLVKWSGLKNRTIERIVVIWHFRLINPDPNGRLTMQRQRLAIKLDYTQVDHRVISNSERSWQNSTTLAEMTPWAIIESLQPISNLNSSSFDKTTVEHTACCSINNNIDSSITYQKASWFGQLKVKSEPDEVINKNLGNCRNRNGIFMTSINSWFINYSNYLQWPKTSKCDNSTKFDGSPKIDSLSIDLKLEANFESE